MNPIIGILLELAAVVAVALTIIVIASIAVLTSHVFPQTGDEE